jgi:Ca2+-binding RTX toxin-like protein
MNADALTFTAAPGEANVLFIFQRFNRYQVIDFGAELTPGTGCFGVVIHDFIECNLDIDPNSLPRKITVFTGDLNDDVDVLAAGGFAEVSGEEGNDVLYVDAVCDQCPFGAVNVLRGGAGDDALGGERGSDVLDGGPGADAMGGGDGFDYVDYSARADPVFVNFDLSDGEEGEDDLIEPSDVEAVLGGAGDDIFVASSNVVLLRGGAGNDTFLTNSGPGTGPKTAVGGEGDDLLVGGLGRDVLKGRAGSDRLRGSGGDDLLVGGPGGDRLSGGEGDDVLKARDGTSDSVRGRAGFDRARVDPALDVVGSIEAFF